MKFGETFRHVSAPQWSHYNIDYDELKQLIKARTAPTGTTPVTVPGQHGPSDDKWAKLENELLPILQEQHERVNLFTKSKAGELQRRVGHLEKRSRSLNQAGRSSTLPEPAIPSAKQYQLFQEADCVERDIQALSRYSSAQQLAFKKILKKYHKWTGSSILNVRLGEMPSVQFDSNSVLERVSHVKSWLSVSPLNGILPDNALPKQQPIVVQSGASHGGVESTRKHGKRPRMGSGRNTPAAPGSVKRYWNEFDDGDEREQPEPYTIYVNPDESITLPGAETVSKAFSTIYKSLGRSRKRVLSWLPLQSRSNEDGSRQPLLGAEDEERDPGDLDDSSDPDSPRPTPTSNKHKARSSSIFSTHRSRVTSPSSPLDRKQQGQGKTLFRTCLGAFMVSFTLLIISALMKTTGRRKARLEVDAGVVAGVVLATCCGVLGLSLMLLRKDTVPGFHRFAVFLAFCVVCVGSCLFLAWVGTSR